MLKGIQTLRSGFVDQHIALCLIFIYLCSLRRCNRPFMRTLPGSFDEKELLMRLREGDKHAFSVLYEQYYSRLYVQAYRSEEHTSELQSLMRSSYAVFCLNKQTTQ